jgi:AraC-like DNA-binding protein
VKYSEATVGCHADIFCSMVLKFIRIVLHSDYSPKKVELCWQPPEQYHEKYRRHFGCEVVFSAPMSRLYVESRDLDTPLPGANANLALYNDQLTLSILAELKRSNLQSRVYARLIEFLPDAECSREKVARSLNMSESSLRQKLRAENTCYQVLLDKVRSEMAQNYLGDRGLTISETAFLLGFTDSSNFTRAFKRWLGKSPSEFKRQQLK